MPANLPELLARPIAPAARKFSWYLHPVDAIATRSSRNFASTTAKPALPRFWTRVATRIGAHITWGFHTSSFIGGHARAFALLAPDKTQLLVKSLTAFQTFAA